MPVISYFFGIYVRMYHDDHSPPHFHVEYQGHEALMAIENGEILAGELPSKAIKLVREWVRTSAGIIDQLAVRHRTETATAYSRSR
jgi:hypothetical protein